MSYYTSIKENEVFWSKAKLFSSFFGFKGIYFGCVIIIYIHSIFQPKNSLLRKTTLNVLADTLRLTRDKKSLTIAKLFQMSCKSKKCTVMNNIKFLCTLWPKVRDIENHLCSLCSCKQISRYSQKQ